MINYTDIDGAFGNVLEMGFVPNAYVYSNGAFWLVDANNKLSYLYEVPKGESVEAIAEWIKGLFIRFLTITGNQEKIPMEWMEGKVIKLTGDNLCELASPESVDCLNCGKIIPPLTNYYSYVNDHYIDKPNGAMRSYCTLCAKQWILPQLNGHV